MKALTLTTAVLMMTAANCHGQVRGKKAGSARARSAIAKQVQGLRDAQEKHLKAMAVGLSLFGADKRWGVKGGEFAGTLASKRPSDFKVGDWGCTSQSFRVIGKVSISEFLVIPKYKGSDVMLIRGLDTAKVTDGVYFVLQHPVVIQSTYSYTTVSGARKTVLALERNDAKLKEVTEKIKELAEAALYRTWTTRNETMIAKFIGYKNRRVILQRKDEGKTIEILVTDLSRKDVKWYRTELKRRVAEKRKQSKGSRKRRTRKRRR